MEENKNINKNRFLVFILYIKIILTILLWAAPLLFLPAHLFEKLGIPTIRPGYYGRLLGIAYFALIAGYLSGLKRAKNGIHPIDTIVMGIISNGGASIVLFSYSLMGAFENLKPLAKYFAYFSAIVTGLITILLFIAHLLKIRNDNQKTK